MANLESFARARFVVGTVVAIVPFLGVLPPPLTDATVGQIAMAAVGVVLLVTATFRYCPASALLGFRSCTRGSE